MRRLVCSGGRLWTDLEGATGVVKRGLGAAAGVLLLALASGCGSSGETGRSGETGGDGENSGPNTLTVYAAASLQEPFEQIGEEFEAAHDGVEVSFNFAGSSGLVTQIREGAPADVFASADIENMDKLVGAELHGDEPQDFAANTLMIAVPAGNPAGITDLASFTGDDVALVVCAPQVPCGAATERVEQSAGLEFTPASEEQSVTDVLGKVSTGEADAGLVYVTDVLKAGEGVEGIGFPEAAESVNTYPIATVEGSENAELGRKFIDVVLSETGREILDGYGFSSPVR